MILEQVCDFSVSYGHRADMRSVPRPGETCRNSNDTFVSEFSLRYKINSSKMFIILGHNKESILLSCMYAYSFLFFTLYLKLRKEFLSSKHC